MASTLISKQSARDAARLLQEETDRADILVTLKREHGEMRSLLAQLQEAEGAAERRALVRRIKAALLPHTRAEEKVVYAALVALKDKHAKQDGYEGYLEHEWAVKTLARLEKIPNPTSAEHRAAGKVLRELVEHHIREEEHAVWVDIRAHFDEAARLAMNRDYVAARQASGARVAH